MGSPFFGQSGKTKKQPELSDTFISTRQLPPPIWHRCGSVMAGGFRHPSPLVVVMLTNNEKRQVIDQTLAFCIVVGRASDDRIISS